LFDLGLGLSGQRIRKFELKCS